MPITPWQQQRSLEKNITSIPGMVQPMEQNFFHWYMQEIYTGQGEAIELGPFVGRSTAALVDGLTKNSKTPQKILHVYDNFRWEDNWGYENYFSMLNMPKLKGGDSFEPVFLHYVAHWKDRFKTYASDIATTQWNGEDIEFIMIDSMKSWDAARSITLNFFPYLIPGVATIVQQDFKFFHTPWVALSMYRLREYFEPTYSVQDTSSMVFKCTQRVDQEACLYATDFKTFTFEEINAAFEYALSLVTHDGDLMKREIFGGRLGTLLLFTQFIDPQQMNEALQSVYLKELAASTFQLHFPTEDVPWLVNNIRWRILIGAVKGKLLKRLGRLYK